MGTKLLLVQAWILSLLLSTQERRDKEHCAPLQILAASAFPAPSSSLLPPGYRATRTAKEKPQSRTCSFVVSFALVWRGGSDSPIPPDIVFSSLTAVRGTHSPKFCGKAGVSPEAQRLQALPLHIRLFGNSLQETSMTVNKEEKPDCSYFKPFAPGSFLVQLKPSTKVCVLLKSSLRVCIDACQCFD